MTTSFNCPSCGAPLDYQGSDPIIRCPYCNSSVIVPENLRAKPSFSSNPSSFTLSGTGNMGALLDQARRLKEVKDLAAAGEMERAVALYREITAADESTARQAVGALATGQPITLTGMSTAEVMSAVRQARGASGQAVVIDRKTSRSIGWIAGCLVLVFVFGILISVLLPVLGTAAGLFAAFGVSSDGTPAVNAPDISVPGLALPGEPKFASQELSFGGEGTGPGLFGDVRAIAVDPLSGGIFAADYDGGRVQAFDAAGNFLTQWFVQGEHDAYISDMGADRSGHVFVVAFGKILIFDAQGNPLGEVEPVDGGYYDNLDVAADGSLVAVSRGEDIVTISRDWKVVGVIPGAVSSISGDSELDAIIAVDGLGTMYLLGTFNNAVFVYNAEGQYQNRFGSDGDEPGQFRAASAIEVDGQGRIFVSDVQGVQVFSRDGRYLDVIEVEYYAYGLTFDDQGFLYLTTNQKRVEKYRLAP